MIDKDRINLLGWSLAQGKTSSCLAVLTSPDVLSIGLSTVFSLAGVALCLPDLVDQGIWAISKPCLKHAAETVFTLGVLEATWWCIAGEGKSLFQKSIDTRPDATTPPSSEVWLTRARQAKYIHLLLGAGYCCGALSTPALVGTFSAESWFAAGITALPAVIREGWGAYRWHKVQQCDWIVEDHEPLLKRNGAKPKKSRRFGIFVPDGA